MKLDAGDRGSAEAYRVLVVDDAPDLLETLRLTLEAGGYDVACAGSGKEALAIVEKSGLPHLAVLDIMMPGMDGLELSRRLLKFSDLPIIFLTAVDEEQTMVRAIREYAEDYITKPFLPSALLARVERVLRRFSDFSYAAVPRVEIDERVTIDFAHKLMVVENEEVSLTPTESKILHILVRSKGRPVATGFLLRRVWPLEEVFEDTLRVHVHRLRQKIERGSGTPEYLCTVRGLGYVLCPSETESG